MDWPLAIALLVVFVVMSLLRWRYFRSLARRRGRRAASRPPGDANGAQ